MEKGAYLPATAEEMAALGWDRADVILVTGDSYIDSPYVGVAVIGRVLSAAGFRTAVIAQPDPGSDRDIKRLGAPRLFWGVTGGSVDSMVANYTASKKRRHRDDFTPGGRNDRRPDRAVIRYCNLIRRWFRPTAPIVLGGIEASLRRISHYDFWSDAVRRPLLFDARADYLVYGMGEKAVAALAAALEAGEPADAVAGTCTISASSRDDYLELPPFEAVRSDPAAFTAMFRRFYRNNDPLTARGLCQRVGDRYLLHHPPAPALSGEELDAVHDLDYQRDLHPHDRRRGVVQALDTIRFSIPIHRGCYGECHFCAIAVHQGRRVQWRGERSILMEARAISRLKGFRGVVTDAGGPTANMYGFECARKLSEGACRDKRCLYPAVCPSLRPDHRRLVALLGKLRAVPGVRHLFTASGVRPDLVFADEKTGMRYLEVLVSHHVSGQLKIAPEHVERHVLERMGKAGADTLPAFKAAFDTLSRRAGKRQFLTYYFIAAHPGCDEGDMRRLKRFAADRLKIRPQQVQVFTPTPSTWSTVMYHTGVDPFSGETLHVERSERGRERQKRVLVPAPPGPGNPARRK